MNSAPLIFILRSSTDHAERLQYVYDVVDASSFYTKLLGARVQKQHTLPLDSVVVKETSAKFTQGLLFS